MVDYPEKWQYIASFVEIRSPWLTLIGEKFKDEQQNVLDYWRVEKADSVVIIPIQKARFLLPKPIYRPGVRQATLDFPGGRVLPEQKTIDAARVILQKELSIQKSDIISLKALNQTGWAINSSFSNQKLYGFVAEINSKIVINPDQLTSKNYFNTVTGIKNLLQDLTCLQCRTVLLEWQHQLLITE